MAAVSLQLCFSPKEQKGDLVLLLASLVICCFWNAQGILCTLANRWPQASCPNQSFKYTHKLAFWSSQRTHLAQAAVLTFAWLLAWEIVFPPVLRQTYNFLSLYLLLFYLERGWMQDHLPDSFPCKAVSFSNKP